MTQQITDADQTVATEALVAEANAREAEFRGVTPPVPVVAAEVDADKLTPEQEAAKVTADAEAAAKVTADADAEAAKVAAAAESTEARAIAKAAGINFEAMTTQFNTDGTISVEAYKALSKIGIPKEFVDAYIDGQKAQASAVTTAATAAADATSIADATAIRAVAGGTEGYNNLVAWIGANIPTAEIDAYDADVTSGDTRRATLATTAMFQRFRAEGGKAPALLNGARPSASAGEGFASFDAYVAAVSDPRYDKDPAYRASVEAKAAR